MAVTPFKAIQSNRFWYQSKAHMDFLLVINTNLPPLAPFSSYGWLYVIFSLL